MDERDQLRSSIVTDHKIIDALECMIGDLVAAGADPVIIGSAMMGAGAGLVSSADDGALAVILLRDFANMALAMATSLVEP